MSRNWHQGECCSRTLGSFYDLMASQWAAKSDTYDMVVGDSQWTGQGATQGHYVDLTDFMKSNGIDTTVTEATLNIMENIQLEVAHIRLIRQKVMQLVGHIVKIYSKILMKWPHSKPNTDMN